MQRLIFKFMLMFHSYNLKALIDYFKDQLVLSDPVLSMIFPKVGSLNEQKHNLNQLMIKAAYFFFSLFIFDFCCSL